MKFGSAMRPECVTVNPDGTYTVKGGGWFWVRFRLLKSGALFAEEMAPGMMQKKAAREFLQSARATVEKYFPEA
jgi:hypothetical protein